MIRVLEFDFRSVQGILGIFVRVCVNAFPPVVGAYVERIAGRWPNRKGDAQGE
jgi:hypothetical protein